MINQENLTN